MNSPEIVSQPNHIYTEPDPFERAVARLNGLQALQVVADCAMELEDGPTSKVWGPLWYFVATVTEDIKRDMHEMLHLQQSVPEATAAE